MAPLTICTKNLNDEAIAESDLAAAKALTDEVSADPEAFLTDDEIAAFEPELELA